ncbi:ATP-binding cassette long-chain fatty acid transporter pxa1 [Malassezia brasiliensis]|uniref:ATP-binding cassette long-chain fatty acid transporter pxa1 n=1 Tax=Malassezia brasiliensis TaxID=1821822 RepID=A0AAF0DXW0_9BASI|nr:ATP-binding cassette long-chain fatty acid transporter pxa1 [Malassezia brasiliensis]
MATQSKLRTVWQPTLQQRRVRGIALLLVLVLALGRKQWVAWVQQRLHGDRLALSKVTSRRKKQHHKHEEQHAMGLEEGLEKLYIPTGDKDNSVYLLVPFRGRFSKVLVTPTKQETFDRNFPYFALPPPVNPETMKRRSKLLSFLGGASVEQLARIREAEAKISPGAGESITSASALRVGVDREFFRQLRALLRVMIPSLRSKEVLIFSLHTFFLVMRTYLSVLVARLDGSIVKSLISADGPGFLRGLVLWFVLAVPSTYTNAMIRYLQSKLAIGFRTRLTRYVNDLYLSSSRNYYKVLNLDNRLEAVSQYITSDITDFCEVISDLYSNISKPLLDIIIFLGQIGSSLGFRGMMAVSASYYIASFALRFVSPPFGKLSAIQAKLEGQFRNAHSRLIINAEEIAFYNGASTEETILQRMRRELISHTKSIMRLRIGYTFTEDFVLKYTWSAIGYMVMAIPSFAKRERAEKAAATGIADADTVSKGIANETETYISNRRLLLSLADAGSRLMYSYKGIAELAGQTSRVYSLISTLHLLDHNIFQSVPRPVDLPKDAPFYDLGHLDGKMIADKPYVEFSNAPIVTPAPGQERGGELLVNNLSLRADPGDHIMITGPNGVGKTAIARVLASLWPLFDGRIDKPSNENMFFLPQRPYLTTGSLREQVIYPYSYQEHVASGRTDEDLMDILRHVHLAYLPNREGGWETRKEWKDVLSGGEKQRMGMARLFYHKPTYAVLDECTSAVSTDVEGLMYSHAKDMGMTLITISHRPSLFKYHTTLLDLKGEHGDYEVIKLVGDQQEQTLEQELSELQKKLSEVDNYKKRLAEIQAELSFSKT